MKKRIAALALSALFLFALSACGNKTAPEEPSSATDPIETDGGTDSGRSSPAVPQPDETEEPPAGPVTVRVKLLPNDWGQILVTDWGNGEHPIGLCSVSVQNAQIIGMDGEIMEADALRPGMVLDVTWNGLVQESFPCALEADEVQVAAQEDDLVGLYRQILLELWTETGQKSGVECLGFDLSGLTGLTDGERAALAYLSACDLELPFNYSIGT